MIDRLKGRLAAEEGFTLIELLVVIIILGILLAIAVPSYLSFKDRANKTAAAANVRTLVDSIEQYNADNVPGGTNDPDATGAPGVLAGAGSSTDSGYAGMTMAELKGSYDQSLNVTAGSNGENEWVSSGDANFPTGVTMPTGLPSSASYCAVAQVGNWFAYKLGPSGNIQETTTAASVCT